jgi:peptidoglycan/LPS O-acetylase OafA/YrhL
MLCIFSYQFFYNGHFSLALFFVVYVLIDSQLMKLFLSNTIMSYLGKISYPIYLTHLIIVCSVSCFLFNRLYALIHIKTLCVIITWVATFFVTIVVLHFFYLTVEKGTVQLTKRLYILIESYYRMMCAPVK